MQYLLEYEGKLLKMNSSRKFVCVYPCISVCPSVDYTCRLSLCQGKDCVEIDVKNVKNYRAKNRENVNNWCKLCRELA